MQRFLFRDLCYLAIVALMFSGCTSKISAPKQPAPPAVSVPPPSTETPPEPKYDANVFAPLHPKALASRVTVLMFHDVVLERGKGGVYFDSTVAEFNEILDYFDEQGAHYLSLKDFQVWTS